MGKQLEEEILSSICSKQLRIHLSMSKADIYEGFFSDSCSLQRQKFHQVSSKFFILDIVHYSGPLAEIYEDEGNRYESIPPIIVDGALHGEHTL